MKKVILIMLLLIPSICLADRKEKANVTVGDVYQEQVKELSIEWDSLSFVYNVEIDYVWDNDIHDYHKSVKKYWSNDGNKIKVTNKSSSEIIVVPKYTNYINGISGTFSKKEYSFSVKSSLKNSLVSTCPSLSTVRSCSGHKKYVPVVTGTYFYPFNTRR